MAENKTPLFFTIYDWHVQPQSHFGDSIKDENSRILRFKSVAEALTWARDAVKKSIHRGIGPRKDHEWFNDRTNAIRNYSVFAHYEIPKDSCEVAKFRIVRSYLAESDFNIKITWKK